MDDEFTLRPATVNDTDFLASMLREAINWDPARESLSLDAVLASPDLAHYIVGWPQDGDVGVVAEILDHRVGAAWLRRFTRADHGFGYVADDIPEMTIAVAPGHRGDGIGTRLMHTIEIAAAAAGYDSISLSTERTNYAHSWYTGLGYRVVADDQHSDTMVKNLGSTA
jgi:ribosomal protein S18 acetylase RimI-like enzyme